MSERVRILEDGIHKNLLEFGRSLLTTGSTGHEVAWPDANIQRNYTGSSGEDLMRRTADFVWLLRSNVPALSNKVWQGLDYGVGWGRIASMMGYFGDAASLDCVDAWQRSLDHARNCGLRNRMGLVSAFANESELPRKGYDIIYAYSIFTHLPAAHIANNVGVLYRALKPGGRLVFTVREPKFLDYLRSNNRQVNAVIDRLESEGYWFGNAQSEDYGDTVITAEWMQSNLGELGEIRNLGFIGSEPYQAIMMMTKHD